MNVHLQEVTEVDVADTEVLASQEPHEQDRQYIHWIHGGGGFLGN